MKAEYADFQESVNSMSLNLTTDSTSFPTLKSSDFESEKSVDIQYSMYGVRNLKRAAKRKRQLHKADDFAEGFQSVRRVDIPRHKTADILSRNVVFVIVSLALNHIDSELQLGDMLRYIREGHISFYNIKQFFPENVNTTRIQHQFVQSNMWLRHNQFRHELASMATLTEVQIHTPNISMLCQRYVRELELPDDVYRLIEILLIIYPPEMKYNSKLRYTFIPNYEARAMSYVIFVLKLLFGIDDYREEIISKSASEINRAHDSTDYRTLFVWDDWVKYIEMRNVILAECHYPTAMMLNPNSEHNTQLYVDYLAKFKQKYEDDAQLRLTVNDKRLVAELTNVHEIFNEIRLMHKDEHKKPSLFFRPSTTPQRSYLEHILENRSSAPSLNIPDFLLVHHYERDVLAFLRPSKLKATLRSHNIDVCIQEHGYSPKFQFGAAYRSETTAPALSREIIQITHNISEDEWLKTIKHKLRQQEIYDRKKRMVNDDAENMIKLNLEKIREKNRHIKLAKNVESEKASTVEVVGQLANRSVCPPSVKDDTSISDIFSLSMNEYLDIVGPEFAEILMEPRRNLDAEASVFDCVSSDEDEPTDLTATTNDPYSQRLTMAVSNGDYWLTIGNMTKVNYDQFSEILAKLPKNFQWLLKQCAQIIENDPRDLYAQLMILENCYAHVLAPLNEMTGNSLNFQRIHEYKNVDMRLYRTIVSLSKQW